MIVDLITRNNMNNVFLRSDQEPAMNKIQQEVCIDLRKQGISCYMSFAPAYSSASTGSVGQAQQVLLASMRAHMSLYQYESGQRISICSDLYKWLVCHNCWLYNRYHRRGRIPSGISSPVPRLSFWARGFLGVPLFYIEAIEAVPTYSRRP